MNIKIALFYATAKKTKPGLKYHYATAMNIKIALFLCHCQEN